MAVSTPANHGCRRLVRRSQRMAFWVLYDHLGHFIGLNMLSIALIGLPLCLGLALADAYIVWFAPLAGAGLCMVLAGQAHVVNLLLAGEAFAYGAMLDGVRRFGPRALLLGAMVLAAAGICAAGAWFYGSVFAERYPLPGVVLAQLCLGTGVIVLMAAFHAAPALVVRRGGALDAAWTGVALTARHPVASAGLLAVAVLYGVALLTPPGLVMLSTLPVVSLSCCAYELLARHYSGNAVCDGDDDYLNRGFGDFLYPWKE